MLVENNNKVNGRIYKECSSSSLVDTLKYKLLCEKYNMGSKPDDWKAVTNLFQWTRETLDDLVVGDPAMNKFLTDFIELRKLAKFMYASMNIDAVKNYCLVIDAMRPASEYEEICAVYKLGYVPWHRFGVLNKNKTAFGLVVDLSNKDLDDPQILEAYDHFKSTGYNFVRPMSLEPACLFIPQ